MRIAITDLPSTIGGFQADFDPRPGPAIARQVDLGLIFGFTRIDGAKLDRHQIGFTISCLRV